MSADLFYRIHGLVLRSAVSLPLPSIGAAPVDVDYQVAPVREQPFVGSGS